ncbi:MAG TPA: hypothetical protein VEI57_01915 [Nitrospirota bacterium]|nr:hypothetical protein [Nitrospirota bacterium]
MSNRIWLSLLAVIFISFGGVTAFAGTPVGVYRNVNKGFSMSFPRTWEIKEGVAGMDVIASPPPEEKSANQFRPTVTVITEILPKIEPINEYAQKRLANDRVLMTDLKFIRTGRQVISHTIARWWIISYRDKTVTVKGFIFIVIKGNKAITITCVASLDDFPAYKNTLGNIASSLAVD